jgi:hypothetical protein
MAAVITQVGSPADWRGDQIAGSHGWRLRLSDTDRAELLSALAAAQAAGVTLSDVSRTTFPLLSLGPRLERLARDVTHGPGFALVQGVPVDDLTEQQCEIVSLGIAGYFGGIVPQGPDQSPLLHVRDQGVDPSRSTSRSYQHSRRLGFHADPTDIVALLCIRPAKAGGLSSIVSTVAVHNEIMRSRPDLAHVLYQPWWFDRRSGDGQDSFYQQPVYAVDAEGCLVTNYGPDYMLSAQRGAHVPPLSAAQLAAMETVDRLNNDPRFVLTMDLQAGDMQFLNNHVVLHGRTAYEDHAEWDRRRDLVRLWLETE